MNRIILKIGIAFGFIRCFLHLLIYNLHPNKTIMQIDVMYWMKMIKKSYGKQIGLIYLLQFSKEFRNLFYMRVGRIRYLVKWILPPKDSLYLATNKIGGGLFILHGFSTIVNARSIGNNCHIFQQVTIGYNNGFSPTILDNVTIAAGAKVLGNITIGNNVVIGANAVVTKDVPDNCTVVGVPAYIIKRNGIRVNEML